MPDCVVVNPANRATAGRQPAAGGPERKGLLPSVQEGRAGPAAGLISNLIQHLDSSRIYGTAAAFGDSLILCWGFINPLLGIH